MVMQVDDLNPLDVVNFFQRISQMAKKQSKTAVSNKELEPISLTELQNFQRQLDVAACAVETIRRNMASALGDEVVNEMAIDADLETLRAFGDGKWKVAVIIEIPREKIPPGRWSDRVMIDGMNGAAISTVELTDGKLKQTSVDADIDEIVAKFPGTKAAKAAEAKKTRPIIE